MVEQLTEDHMAKFEDLFKLYDMYGYGRITPKDLGTVMSTYGKDLTKAELHDMINKVGADGNGNIDFTGFVNLVVCVRKYDKYVKNIQELEKERVMNPEK